MRLLEDVEHRREGVDIVSVHLDLDLLSIGREHPFELVRTSEGSVRARSLARERMARLLLVQLIGCKCTRSALDML